jgi:hypothetical protein
MKSTLFTLALVTVSFAGLGQSGAATPAAVTAAAPTDAYTTMMRTTIQELMSTGDVAKLKQADAKLERAAQAAPKEWLPRYYQAYARLITCFVSKEDGDIKDKYLDQAEAALGQAQKLGAEESERLVLQAYIYQARLGISPMVRSMKYSKMVTETLNEAKKANPANPRIYLVQANNVYYTPAMFGGGADVAKPLYQEAKARFSAFQPKSVLMPNWGEQQLNGRLKSYETAAAN